MASEEATLERPGLSRPNDARAVRSRKALRAALLRLLEEKPIGQVQIKELTAAAGVSYPVFFRQYRRIEEVLNEIATAEVQALFRRGQPGFSPATRLASVRELCGYVAEQRTVWRQLLTTDAAATMRAEFARQADRLREERGRQRPDLPHELVTALMVGGIFEVFTWWLRQPDDLAVDEVAHLLSTLVIEPVYADAT